MKLVLLRHAQKGITPFVDPHLTEIGFRQAENLEALVQKKILPAPTQGWASPKIRTAQTIKKTCDAYKIQVQISANLDLRSPTETSQDFRQRIANLICQYDERALHETDETHFLCTHYDVIEEAMTLINSDKDLNSFEFSHWSPTQYIVFEPHAGLWKVIKKGNANANFPD